MRWDLEERTEDAVVSYLKTVVDGSIRIVAAWEFAEPQYPRAVVHADLSGPVSEPAAWDDARTIAVSVAVQTEATNEINNSAETMRTARERNAAARSEVMNALAIGDLAAQLKEQGVEAIAFSMAQVTTCARSVEDNHLISEITIEVIAEPVTGS